MEIHTQIFQRIQQGRGRFGGHIPLRPLYIKDCP